MWETPILFLVWVVYRIAVNRKWKRAMNEVSVARAGLAGERMTEDVLKSLPNNYFIFSDFSVEAKGKESQIDHALVGPTGIFVIETKYWSGDIIDGDSPDQVIQVHRHGGNIPHYHPSKQVGTHVYRLSRFLKDRGIHEWVNGCVYFSHEDANVLVENNDYPCFDRPGELLNYIRKNREGQDLLTPDRIEEIVKVLKKA